MYGYFKQNKADEVAVFDVFFRQNSLITYSLFAGLEQAVDYVLNLKFDKEENKKLCFLKADIESGDINEEDNFALYQLAVKMTEKNGGR